MFSRFKNCGWSFPRITFKLEKISEKNQIIISSLTNQTIFSSLTYTRLNIPDEGNIG